MDKMYTVFRRFLEVSDTNEDRSVDIPTGFDGSWPQRGWTSSEGLVSAIAEQTAQVLDVHHMINFCRECSVIKSELESGKIDNLAFLQRTVTHLKSGNCFYNHDGSPRA